MSGGGPVRAGPNPNVTETGPTSNVATARNGGPVTVSRAER